MIENCEGLLDLNNHQTFIPSFIYCLNGYIKSLMDEGSKKLNINLNMVNIFQQKLSITITTLNRVPKPQILC